MYTAELQFVIQTLNKRHIPARVFSKEDTPNKTWDLGLRHQLGLDAEYTRFFGELWQLAQPHTIHTLTDQFLSCYIFLPLPDGRLLLIGPYLAEEPTRNQLLELAERIGVPAQQFRRLETYYSGLISLAGDVTAFLMVTTLGERMWGKNQLSTVDINREMNETVPLPTATQPEDTLHNMQILESRYAYENELLSAVSQGSVHKAELFFGAISQRVMEERLTDRLRNAKNYAIIMNTLLRKAAERGGVHPLYLDRISTDYARRIELLPTAAKFGELLQDMFRGYCRLVRRHANRNYSPPVQRVIACVDTDCSGDLSLKALADMQNMNACYLSTLFRRETGETLTQHVNRKRMQLAVRLLHTTHLQVQTVAQHCGIPDVNYFCKLFKKHTGKTPREFRQNPTIPSVT